MAGEDPVVREEYFENQPTGVEAEDDGDEQEITRPWDPDTIRVSTKQFSLRNILDLIDDGDLELAPDFQRRKVWKPGQRSRLIESILLQIPLPAFYFAEDANGMMRVVDGLQRLSTVHDFVRGGKDAFTLTSLEYISAAERKRFVDLSASLQRRIHNAQIVVHVIDPTTPRDVKYDIFKRINTGGTPLNGQEIRHCMSRDRSRELLKRCTAAAEFDLATGGRFANHIRMDDREVVLRFCAFSLLSVEGYINEGSMDAFLESTTELLDDPRRVPDDRLRELFDSFRRAMLNCHTVFGDHAFRKWPRGASARNPINRPLFETWSTVLSRFEHPDVQERRELVVTAARDLMTHNRFYIDAISISTGDPKKVRLRFELTEQAARAGL
ncbi:MAG TPA: DUF262 domain-containing protein [Micromonosporaceae bacterium]|nr:DUF262 domain-containing protein [Micromonosporaceae bacterium]